MSNIREIIKSARCRVNHEPQLAIYMVRDYPETKKARLHDLAWDFCEGTVHPNEARWFLDKLEESLGLEQ